MNIRLNLIVMATVLVGLATNCSLADAPSATQFFGGSIKQYLEADGEQVIAALHARPLDDSVKLDSDVLKMMKTLDEINQTSTKVYWADDVGCSAHPGVGITLNHKELRKFQQMQDPKQFNDVIRLILAHEQAHMLQFQYYDLRSMGDATKTRSIEAQADLLAGATVIWSLLKERVDPNPANERIKIWMEFSQKAGTDVWAQDAHPRSEQRARLVTLGFNAGLQQVDLANYKRTKDPAVWKRIKDAQETSKQRKIQERNAMMAVGFHDFKTGRGYDYDLPVIDDNALEQEKLMDWSNRLAKVIVHYGDALGG